MKYSFSLERALKVAPMEAMLTKYLVDILKATVLPAGKFCVGEGAPVAITPNGDKVLPDNLAWLPNGKMLFVECKCADNAPLNRRYASRVMGFKKGAYSAYCELQGNLNIDCLVVFVLQNKYVLTINLRTAEPLPCICKGCQNGNECQAEGLVYFRLGSMQRRTEIEKYFFGKIGGK